MYAFGSIHWERQGFSGTAIGALWAVGVVAEIVLFHHARRLGRWLGPASLVAVGAVAAVLRWSLMPLEPGLAATFALQALHGLTFGATHLGLVHFIGESFAADRAARAQSVAATVMGAAMAGLTTLSGVLYGRLGATAFLAMAATGVLALLVLAAARTLKDRPPLQPQRAGSGGDTSGPS